MSFSSRHRCSARTTPRCFWCACHPPQAETSAPVRAGNQVEAARSRGKRCPTASSSPTRRGASSPPIAHSSTWRSSRPRSRRAANRSSAGSAGPGVDLNVLIANLRQHGAVRLFATTLRGEYGTTAEVEISAVSVPDGRTALPGLHHPQRRPAADARLAQRTRAAAVGRAAHRAGRARVRSRTWCANRPT